MFLTARLADAHAAGQRTTLWAGREDGPALGCLFQASETLIRALPSIIFAVDSPVTGKSCVFLRVSENHETYRTT